MKAYPLPNNILRRIAPGDRQPLGKAGQTMDEANVKHDLKCERELQKQVYNFLLLKESEGKLWFAYQNPTKRATGRIGTPDFVVCYQGHFVAFECKFGAGVCTDEQLHAIRKINDAGGTAVVVRDLDEVRDWLKTIDESIEKSRQ